MNLMSEYRRYRKIGMELNSRIMHSCLDRDALMKSAKLLGIVRGDTVILDTDERTSVLMDFALNEYRVNGKNAFETHLDKKGWRNKREKDILHAYLSSFTSLFRVVTISKIENTLLLHDLLSKRGNLRLIDIAFSKCAVPELLSFTRVLPFENFNMTSGISFAFTGDLDSYLLRRCRTLSKKVTSDSDSVRRFVSFFKLSQTDGMEVRYE